MGRVKPMNGTVGITKPKANEVRTALASGNLAEVEAFLNEAVEACESGEYIVLTGSGE